MTEESERTANGRESSPRSGAPGGEGAGSSVYYSAARHGQHVEESPELLRWRADMLMDEMMMGGADGSAADPNTRTFSGVDNVTSLPDPYYPTRNGTDHTDHYGQATPIDRDRTARQDGMPSTPPLNGGRYESRDLQDRYAPGMIDGDPSAAPGNGSYTNGGESTYRAGHDAGVDEPSSANSPVRRMPPPSSASSPEGEASAARMGDPGTADRHKQTGDDLTGDSQSGDVDRTGVDFGFEDEPSTLRTQSEPLPQDRRLDLPSTPPRTHLDVAPVASEGGAPVRTDRLYSVEQRYEQLRRAQADRIEPAPIPPPPTVAPKPPRSAAAAPDANDPTQWATGPEKWNWQDFGAQPGDDAATEGAQLAPSRYGSMDRAPQADNAAVRQDPAQFVNSMSVFENKKKRSTLLPRMTELDADMLHREITALHGELALLLPVGNETGERARHLLDKAYTILQSDPMRSAEVEYYMQQVRTIVSRLHQSRQWSDLYRSRLRVYLWAWLGLSLVLLLARFIFQPEFDNFLVTTFGLAPDSFLVQNWSAFLGTAFAGALGGAAGALYTMRVHARTEYGFFDRKYGLRGLILPVMGLLVGAIGYWIFALVYAITGINPSDSLVAGLIPALAALAFGLSQETIYGTRGS